MVLSKTTADDLEQPYNPFRGLSTEQKKEKRLEEKQEIKRVVQMARDQGKKERDQKKKLDAKNGLKSVRFKHPAKISKPLMKNIVDVKIVNGKAIYNIQRHPYYQ